MSQRHRVVKKLIGELLIERGFLTQEQLQEALRVQKESKKLIGEILLELGYVSEEEVMICLTTQYGLPYLPLESYEINDEVISSVPADLVKKYRFIPIDRIGDMVTIASSNILAEEALTQIESTIGVKVEYFVTTPTALRKAIEKYYP